MDPLQLPSDVVIYGGAALLVGGVLAAGAAQRLRLPGLLLFLGIGMILGDDGLALISLSDPAVAQFGAVIALVLILYEGGLATKPSDFRRAAGPGLVLATLGVVVTAAITAAGVALMLDVDLSTALLIGAVVASTDAAAVFAVLRQAPLPRRLTALLEVESGTNDPTAIVLTLGVIAAVAAPPGVLEVAAFTVRQLGGGAVIGVAFGYAGAWLLRKVRLGLAGLYPVLALGIAGLAYGTGAALGASGFLAVYIVGLFVGAQVPRHRRTIRQFHSGLASTAEIGLFLLLGFLVFPSRLAPVALPALAITAVLVLVARPVAVAVSLPWFGFSVREQLLTSWAGLRGAVPIVLATFPLTAGVPEGATIFNVVFFVVLVSTLLQGSTIQVVARWLGLRADPSPWVPVAEALPLDGVDADLIEVDVVAGLPIVGRPLREVPLPPGARLTAILREDRFVMPTGDTTLQPGDLALAVVSRRSRPTAAMVAWAKGELAPADERPEPASRVLRDDR